MIRNKLLLILTLLFGLCLSGCDNSEDITLPREEKTQFKTDITLPKPEKNLDTEYIMLYFDGLLFDKAVWKNDMVFVSPDSISDYYGLGLSTEFVGQNFEISGYELNISGKNGEPYLTANYRYLYTPEGYLIKNNRLYLSEPVIEKIFGLKLTVYGDPKAIEVSSEGVSLIKGGANYYEINYGTEDLFWLPRIIYAESKGQPFAGLIGVGNVVYNRVEHELFPDTVFEVIFDSEYAVQFTPAATGAVMDKPDERSVVAACLCLEGYNTVGESLYFVNPEKGSSRWFEEELEFMCTIGNHDFYGQ